MSEPTHPFRPTRSLAPARDLARLVEIMARLRDPVDGCPWDLEQSFATIVPCTIEEAYEVADAIERGDLLDLRDELGDLLLQVVYHSQLAAEIGAFELGDVVFAITRKMIRRHPHVFGDQSVFGEKAGGTSADAATSWARIKAEEKAERAAERAAQGQSQAAARTLADVPASLPALTRAIKLQTKAAAVGFDWPSLAPVFDKMREELAELEEVALPAGSEDGLDRSRVEEELGDLLFVIANVARHLGLDPEAALRGANAKFTRRFGVVEAKLAAAGKTPAQSDLAEMDAFWNEAKREEKG